MGYLPEALLNYLGMMGWTIPSGEEKFSLGEMEASFDISRVSLGGPIFDIEKLDWLNGKYIREELSDEEFAARFAAWAFKPEKVAQIVPLLKQRVERFSDVASLGGFFIDGSLEISEEGFAHKAIDSPQALKILQFTLWKLEALEELERNSVEGELQSLAAKFELKIRDFLFPLFVALSGKAVSTSVIESLMILGIDITRARIRQAISVLGGISKKQAKALEKEFRNF
jgi:glutamyl-tRNA synthetase